MSQIAFGELLPPQWTCDSVYLVDLDGTYNGTLHDLAKEAGYDVLVTRDYKMKNETRPLMAVLTVPTPFADAARVMRYGDEIVDALEPSTTPTMNRGTTPSIRTRTSVAPAA